MAWELRLPGAHIRAGCRGPVLGVFSLLGGFNKAQARLWTWGGLDVQSYLEHL